MQGLFRGLSWLLFGASFCIAAYKMSTTGLVRTDPLVMTAMIGMALGMLCGGVATTAGVFDERRKRRKAMEEALGGGPAEEHAPPPDPNKPLKQYKVRPLDSEKLKTEPTPPADKSPDPPPSA